MGPAVDGLTEGRKVFNNRYTLIKLLGRSPNSAVWLSWEEEARRDVTLKFLPEMVRTDPTALAVLQREVKKLQEFKHPLLVPVHDVLAEGSVVAIASEYIEGTSLAELRAQKKTQVFSPAELNDWVRELLTFLEHAHADANLVHGDISPTNLLVTEKGALRVTDFDLTRQVADFAGRVASQSATRNPAYLSPQQAAGEPVNFLDDIYSIGATIYELLTSKPPFYMGDILLQIQQKIPPPMTHRRKELRVIGEPVPRVWEEAVAACLSKNSANRPQSAGQLMELLGITPAPAAALPATAAPAAAAAPAKSHTPIIIAAGLGVILLGLMGLWLGKSGSNSSNTTGRSLSPEEKARQKAETDAAIKKATDKAKADAEAKAMADAERVRQDAERRRKLAEDETKRLQAAIDKAKQDEIQRIAVEQKKAREAEEKRKAAEAEAKRLTAEVEKARAKADQDKTATAEKNRMDAEQKQKQAEAEARRLLDEIAKAKLTEAKRLEEESRKAKDAEARRLAAEKEAMRLTQEVERARAAADIERKRLSDISMIKAREELESKRLADAKLALELKAKQDADARQMALLAEKSKAEAESKKKAELAARKLQAGRPWQNSLGMKFVPLGKVLICVWETRVDDFDAFYGATRYDAGAGWRGPGFKQTSAHPVVSVNWNDAKAFCKWLTDRERQQGLIDATASYRLPTDLEWSKAVSLEGESGATPSERDLQVKAHFPWGTVWPPPVGAGNYADNVSYDPFEDTAPAGSFRPNALGIYDLGGNVWEWCEDWADATQKNRVLRGGSYAGYISGSLFSSYRRMLGTTERQNDIGFRCVIDPGR